MRLREALKDGARIWFKSEWAPADDHWPAVSFSKSSVGDYLRQEFRPGRDAIVYVGTSSPATTEKPEHRQRLLSAINIEPQQLLETRECVPIESWENAQQNFRGRWWWSMPALAIWEIEGFPSAYDVAPASYRQLGLMSSRGSVVEVLGSERDAVLQLLVRTVSFVRPYKAGSFTERRAVLDLSKEVRTDIGNMVGRILARVAESGSGRTIASPIRITNESDLHVMLGGCWMQQNGRCFLCNGPLFPVTKNYLLQSSCDRLDSNDVAYSKENTRITHLACNLAKNKVSLVEFEDWITVIRGEVSECASTAGAAGSA